MLVEGRNAGGIVKGIIPGGIPASGMGLQGGGYRENVGRTAIETSSNIERYLLSARRKYMAVYEASSRLPNLLNSLRPRWQPPTVHLTPSSDSPSKRANNTSSHDSAPQNMSMPGPFSACTTGQFCVSAARDRAVGPRVVGVGWKGLELHCFRYVEIERRGFNRWLPAFSAPRPTCMIAPKGVVPAKRYKRRGVSCRCQPFLAGCQTLTPEQE